VIDPGWYSHACRTGWATEDFT